MASSDNMGLGSPAFYGRRAALIQIPVSNESTVVVRFGMDGGTGGMHAGRGRTSMFRGSRTFDTTFPMQIAHVMGAEDWQRFVTGLNELASNHIGANPGRGIWFYTLPGIALFLAGTVAYFLSIGGSFSMFLFVGLSMAGMLVMVAGAIMFSAKMRSQLQLLTTELQTYCDNANRELMPKGLGWSVKYVTAYRSSAMWLQGDLSRSPTSAPPQQPQAALIQLPTFAGQPASAPPSGWPTATAAPGVEVTAWPQTNAPLQWPTGPNKADNNKPHYPGMV